MLEKLATTIRNSTNRNCTALERQADIIINQIGDLKRLHDEIIQEVKQLDAENETEK